MYHTHTHTPTDIHLPFSNYNYYNLNNIAPEPHVLKTNTDKKNYWDKYIILRSNCFLLSNDYYNQKFFLLESLIVWRININQVTTWHINWVIWQAQYLKWIGTGYRSGRSHTTVTRIHVHPFFLYFALKDKKYNWFHEKFNY